MAYTQHLLKHQQLSGSSNSSDIFKYSFLVGTAGGLLASSLFYAYKANVIGGILGFGKSQDQIDLLKKELIRELKTHSIDVPKDADYTFNKDFMVFLFKMLYTYQTIGKEIVKEQTFAKRIQHLIANEHAKYAEIVEEK